jgi:hypothetical protein
LVGSVLLFLHDTARVKSIEVERDIDREPLAFCLRYYVCKKCRSREGH